MINRSRAKRPRRITDEKKPSNTEHIEKLEKEHLRTTQQLTVDLKKKEVISGIQFGATRVLRDANTRGPRYGSNKGALLFSTSADPFRVRFESRIRAFPIHYIRDFKPFPFFKCPCVLIKKKKNYKTTIYDMIRLRFIFLIFIVDFFFKYWLKISALYIHKC